MLKRTRVTFSAYVIYFDYSIWNLLDTWLIWSRVFYGYLTTKRTNSWFDYYAYFLVWNCIYQWFMCVVCSFLKWYACWYITVQWECSGLFCEMRYIYAAFAVVQGSDAQWWKPLKSLVRIFREWWITHAPNVRPYN